MPLAVDTVGLFLTNAATTAETLTDVSVSSGDSLTVKNFTPPAWAKMLAVFNQGVAGDQVRVTASDFHDNVTGLTFTAEEQPSQFLLPRVIGQPLHSGSKLAVKAGAAASSSSITALLNYYSDLPGGAARLHQWGDIAGIIANVKTWEVDITTDSTVGTWTDTAINTTDSQFHAGRDYAILGYESDTALAVIGVKGDATSNLRVCGPGATSTLDITEYFVTMSERHQIPMIPVFNADNKDSFYVSTLDKTGGLTPKVYVIAAELTHTIKP